MNGKKQSITRNFTKLQILFAIGQIKISDSEDTMTIAIRNKGKM